MKEYLDDIFYDCSKSEIKPCQRRGRVRETGPNQTIVTS